MVIPRSVLFVCWGNTCRSVLAEYIGNHLFGEHVQFRSAGVEPNAPDGAQMAIETLQSKYGIKAGGHVPRDIRFVGPSSFDLIIALDENVNSRIGDQSSVPREIWSIADPYGRPDAYATCSDQIEERTREFGCRFGLTIRAKE